MLKDKTFWWTAMLTLSLIAALMPYGMFSDMYIADLFAVLCAILTVFSAAAFGMVFYLWRKKKLLCENFSSMIWLLAFCVAFHAVFAMMSWTSCVIAAAAAALILILAVGKIVRKKKKYL